MADELTALIVAVEKKAQQRIQATLVNVARLIAFSILTGCLLAAGVAAGVTMLLQGVIR